jgi:MMP 1-O-methyltransferase
MIPEFTPAQLSVYRLTKGFLPDDEAVALADAARSVASLGPLLEVGAYCGRSAILLGAIAEAAGSVLFSVDHHHGSEENQAGWEHHDTEVVDARTGRMDTLPFFRRAIEDAKLESSVVAVVGSSEIVGRTWRTPLAFCFIDGGHGAEPARIDQEQWTPKLLPGGILAIHDVFPDEADGGRPPYEQIYLPTLASGDFMEEPSMACGSLRILRRV